MGRRKICVFSCFVAFLIIFAAYSQTPTTMRFIKRICAAAMLAIVLLSSATSCRRGSTGDSTLLPNISGGVNDVLVVLRKELWNDTLGRTYKAILEDQFPYLPQIEPLFDAVMLPPDNFGSTFKSHRNIIRHNIGANVDSVGLAIQKDVWAAPQTVVVISSPTYKEAVPFVIANAERIVNIFEQAERDRDIHTARKYPELDLEQKFLKRGIKVSIPKGYVLNTDVDDFIWISHETPKTSQGIIAYRFPYTEANTFAAEYLTARRNDVVRHIPGPTDGSYMITSDVVPAGVSSMTYRGVYRSVMRGFWDVANHPMGGPFISHAFVDKERQEVVVVEAYVYAPSKGKRDLMRQTEAILFSASLVE